MAKKTNATLVSVREHLSKRGALSLNEREVDILLHYFKEVDETNAEIVELSYQFVTNGLFYGCREVSKKANQIIFKIQKLKES